jgi:PEP-CTERM motif
VRAIRFGVGMAVLVALVGLVEPSTAAAASIVCPLNVGASQPIWDNVTPNLGQAGCEIGGVNNDSATTVNADSMFNLTSWVELSRKDINDTSGHLCATVIAGCDNSVGWNLAGFTNFMLVLKGGVAASPSNYVGYLLPIGTTLIDFTSPFVNPANDNAKDVSHFTLYASRELTSVPEPASLMLLGSGIVALSSRFRRRQPR